MVLYKKNIDSLSSMDETCLSNGEVYTIVTNKEAKGRKGALVAMIRGVKSDTVIAGLKNISLSKRSIVKEITIDLSPTMMLIAKKAFPNASIVNNHFHVQKLLSDVISDLRIALRGQLLDELLLNLKKRVRFTSLLFARMAKLGVNFWHAPDKA